MLTFFKREFKSQMVKLRGVIFTTLTLIVMGVFVFLSNLLNTNPQLEYGLKGSLIAFIVTIPILCASLLSDREIKSIKHLTSLNVKPLNVILGKFFSSACVLLIPTAVMAIMPLFLSIFGYVIFIESYASVFAYFLTGVCLISLCMLISVLIKNGIASLCASILVLLALFAGPTLATYLPTSGIASLIAILILELLLCAVLWAVTKKILFGTIAYALTAGTTLIYHFVFDGDFNTLFARALNTLSPFSRLDNFTIGVFRLSDVVYLLSLTALFLALTYISLRTTIHKGAGSVSEFSEEARSKKLKFTAKTVLTACISLLLMLALNVGILLMPVTLTVFDATGLEMYKIPTKAESILSAVDEDVTIYYLCEGGIADVSIETVARTYAAQSKHIKYKKINTTAQPDFTDKFTYTGANNHSIIVASEKRFALVDSTEFYHYRIGGVSYTELEFNAYMSSIASGEDGIQFTANEYNTYFDLDKKLVSAIEYVTSPKVNTVFTLKGHGEKPISNDFYNYIGVPCEDLDVSGMDKVPEHCSTLIICSPTTDISEADAQKIIDFYEAGGDIILITSPQNTRMENLMSIGRNCGLVPEHGTIIENDEKMYYGDKSTNLIVISNTSHSLVSYIMSESRDYVNPIFPNAHTISKFGATSDKVKITDMFASSNDVMLQDGADTTQRTRTSIVGVSVQKQISDERSANLVWFSSYDAFTEEWVDIRPVNMTYLLASASSIGATSEFVPTVKIDSKDISGNLLKIQKNVPYVWGAVFAIVIPLIVLCAGIAVYVLRRPRKKH